jgi:cyclic pyranopterin phosphate synthase
MPELIDPYARKIEYLRLSVTDRCDLRCRYCIPQGFHGFESPPHWLNFDEIERLVSVFARLGVTKLRLTGGEPLTRHNVTELAARLHAIDGIDDLSMSTNGTLLARHAAALRAAGVSRLNVSLDSLQHDCFARTAGRDALTQVLDGLDAARAAGFSPIKINMVVMSGINEDQVDDMAGFCMEGGFVLRLIEVMPMGETGRNAHYVDLQPVRQRLAERYGLVDGLVPGAGPARYLQSADGRFSVGFITPVSRHFCPTCNRVRLAVDGTLYLCLGQNDQYAFRPLLRGGASDDELTAAVLQAIARKPERHDFRELPAKIDRFMNVTGG